MEEEVKAVKQTRVPLVVTLLFDGDLSDEEIDDKITNLDYSFFVDGTEIATLCHAEMNHITRTGLL